MKTIADVIRNIETRIQVCQEDIETAKIVIAQKEGQIAEGQVVIKELRQVEKSI